MAEFIRPQARAALWRWRECLLGLFLIVSGMAMLGGYGLAFWLGVGAISVGLILVVMGVALARFRRDETGAGVIEITEHQLTYMGPVMGGSVSIDDIYGVALDHQTWILMDINRKELVIPVNARGAEQLFDVFGTLPEFPTAKMLRILNTPREGRITIWRRGTPPIDTTFKSQHLR